MEAERPEGIECPRWRPKRPEAKRCYYYVDNGACELPIYFMCIEWLKLQAPRSAPSIALAELAALARARKASEAAPPSTGLAAALAALSALNQHGGK